MRFIGVLAILTGGISLGFFSANRLKRRIAQLQELRRVILIFKNEVYAFRRKMPDIIRVVSVKAQYPVNRIFEEILIRISQSANIGLEKAFHEGLYATQKEMDLLEDDYKVFRNFASAFHEGDPQNQEHHFQFCMEQISLQEVAAREKYSRNRVLFQYAGLLGSLLIVIVLY